MSDHTTASDSTELSDSVNLSLSESEEVCHLLVTVTTEDHAPLTCSCFVSQNMPESHFIELLE